MKSSPSVLKIDLRAICNNYTRLKSAVSKSCRVGAAVKANAYGLGAAEVSRALHDSGCRDFFVSSLAEGISLRQTIPDSRIYILNGFYTSGADEYAAHNLIPALGSFMEIESFRNLGMKNNRAMPALLHFNTRMNRLGLGAVETEKIIADPSLLKGIDVTGIMSHFACADENGHPVTMAQYDAFAAIAHNFPNAEKSLCNSSGIFRAEKFHFDMVRPGAALYGINPTPEQKNPMEPVVELKASVLRTRMVYKGASVGYGATYTFTKDTWIATIAAGYADGLFRSLSNRGNLYWRGHPCPIRGRVSMDLTTVDLSTVPENERPKPGDMIEILGPNQNVDKLAADARTIGYEILTALGGRYEREYIK